LTGDQLAEAVSNVLGKKIAYVDADKQQFYNGVRPFMPEYQAKGLGELYAVYESGAAANPSPDFKKLTGKEGTRFEDKVRQLHQSGLL